MVYPGGVHTRFEHVLGTMHVAGFVGDSLTNKLEMREEEVEELRLAALLHDVGHGPFSHLFEEVLAERTRLTHEDISQRIVLESGVKDILERYGMSPNRISQLCVGRMRSEPFLNEVIAGGLSADMMDYLLRDSYFTGVEYGKVDIHRVIDSLHVVEGHLVIDHAALYAFEALLIARYEMFKAVYFHRTVRAAELMLVHSMTLADRELKLTSLSKIDRYLKLTDEIVFEGLLNLKGRSPRVRLARMLAQRYAERNLVKCALERVVQRNDRAVERIFSHKKFREDVASNIAETAGVDSSDVYVDVPTTPSVPYTYAREALKSIGLLSQDSQGRRVKIVSISELPLLGSIAGFVDILRVYTSSENREKVTGAAESLFGKDDSASQMPA